jgi:hypothetical protein
MGDKNKRGCGGEKEKGRNDTLVTNRVRIYNKKFSGHRIVEDGLRSWRGPKGRSSTDTRTILVFQYLNSHYPNPSLGSDENRCHEG